MDAGALASLIAPHPLRASESPVISDTAIEGNVVRRVIVNFILVSHLR